MSTIRINIRAPIEYGISEVFAIVSQSIVMDCPIQPLLFLYLVNKESVRIDPGEIREL